jgi:hypothetical protein
VLPCRLERQQALPLRTDPMLPTITRANRARTLDFTSSWRHRKVVNRTREFDLKTRK